MFQAYGLLRTATCRISRNLSTLQTNTSACREAFLRATPMETGRRCMSGHGPDISRFQAAMYILIGGGGFAAFGTYQAISMRNRIEKFETGKVIPFKTLTDDQFLEYKAKIQERQDDEEEEIEDEDAEQESVASEPISEEAATDDEQANNAIQQCSKDTIIFIEAPKE